MCASVADFFINHLFVALIPGVFGFWIIYLTVRLAPMGTARSAREKLVVGRISEMIQLGLPLATGIALAAKSETGAARRQLAAIARFLSQGLPLSRAMELGYPNSSGLVISLVKAGERAGQLSAAVAQAEKCLIRGEILQRRVSPSVAPYAVLVLTAALTVMAALFILVVPKFEEILTDYGVLEPVLIQSIARSVGPFEGLVAPLFALLLLAVIVVGYLNVRPRRRPFPGSISILADWVRWRVPGLRRLQFAGGLSVLLTTLRFALRSGMQINQAARLSAEIDVNWNLRERMLHFASRLSTGVNPGQAARSAGLGEVAAAALANGQRSGDMDGALRYAADYYGSIISRIWAILASLAWPVCTLALASIIGVLVYASFQPLILILDATINAGGG